MYYVYILKNTEGEKYIGVTHDLKQDLPNIIVVRPEPQKVASIE